jgi:ligand-binding sensor domain-containing protein/signal transduction histidine kinase
VNTVTGDSIQILLTSTGDTVTTGRPFTAKGKIINTDGLEVPLGNPGVKKTNSNVHPISEKLIAIPVDEDKLKRFSIENGKSSFTLINSNGDVIPTGIPVLSVGKIVSVIEKKPVQALPMRMKDNAIFSIQYLDVNQGLSSSYIWSMLEDKRGNLWFGTDESGVIRYDGKSFTQYTEKEGLSNNSVRSMLEDKRGNLWFGTYDGGLSRYDGKVFTHFSEKEGLSNNFIRCIIEDKRGDIWFGTAGGGVIRYDGKSLPDGQAIFTYYTEKEGLPANDVQSIFEDKSGNLWFGTDGDGVCRFDGSLFTHFTEQDGLSNNLVLCILEDSQGNMWFGTRGGGVSRYDGKSFTNYTMNEGLSENRILSVFEDQSGNLWFGTDGGGVNVYDGNSFSYYREQEGLSNNIITAILGDSGGKIWIGTFGGGVCSYNVNSFRHYTKSEGLSSSTVSAVLEDYNGDLWLGTDGGGIIKYDGKTFKHYTEKEGLSNDNVRDIVVDKNGNLWFATDGGGATQYDGQSFTHYTEQEGLISNGINAILEDKGGNLWFGTEGGGILFYDGNEVVNFSSKEGLSSNKIKSILEDKNGNIWFGSDGGGLIKFDGQSFIIFSEKEGLSSNWIGTLLEDKRGNLWLGTLGGGLSQFDGSSFTNYTENEGLSNNRVRSILEDHHGNLWIATEKGLNHFVFGNRHLLPPNIETENEKEPDSPTIFVYDNDDGLKAIDFYFNSGLIDNNNRAWWGTGKGLVTLDIENYSPSKKAPEVRLTRLDLEDQFIDFRNDAGIPTAQITYQEVKDYANIPLHLELPHRRNHITFHFVGIDWNAPHKIKYSYKLDGLNTEWSPPDPGTKADYRNIPFGDYTFKVRAIGESREWGDEVTYSFTIRPPIWFTWRAYLIYGLCFVGGIFVVDRFQRKRLIAKEREKTKAKELAQAKEIEKAYRELQSTQAQLIQSEKMASLGELTAGIAHEIQNPLNFVNNFSEVNDELIEELREAVANNDQQEIQAILDDLKENESKIKHHGQRAEGIVKGMLQHSRSSSGQKELTDINALADEYLRLAYHGLRAKDKSFNAEFNTDFDPDLPKINVVPQDIGRVLLNLINNAFQAVADVEKAEVIVSSTMLDNSIKITVKDNGPGIPDEIKDKIFQPFFTTKPTGSGTGLGLSLSYDIVKAHGGEITVNSSINEGTIFCLSIPINS